MKKRLIAAIHLILASFAFANVYEKRMDSFESDDWLSLYFGVAYWSGDYGSSKHILIQRLPNDRFLLSVSVGSDHDSASNLTVAKEFVTLEEVNKIKDRVIGFAEAAFEERRLYKERIGTENIPQESYHTTLVMKVSQPGGNKSPFDGLFSKEEAGETFDYGKPVVVMTRFDLDKPTHEAYSKFLNDLIHKVEPVGSGQPM